MKDNKKFYMKNISNILSSVIDEYGNSIDNLHSVYMLIVNEFIAQYIISDSDVITIPVESFVNIHGCKGEMDNDRRIIETLEGMSITYHEKDYGFVFDEVLYEEGCTDEIDSMEFCITLTASKYFKKFIRDLFIDFF